MKKLIYLMLLCATFTTFTACKSEDESDTNSLAGTTWTSRYVDEIIVIEFETENKVSCFWADLNMNISGSVRYGTYAVSGNRVTLTNFYLSNIAYKYHFTDGTVVGNNMTVNYWFEMHYTGTRFDNNTMTFRKK